MSELEVKDGIFDVISEATHTKRVAAATETIWDLVKQAGYVQLDEDQSLPKMMKAAQVMRPDETYQLAQYDMLKDNFKKIRRGNEQSRTE